MKKGDIFEGKVIRTEFPNKGIIYIEGQKVIVKNALEGQVVRFSINKKKRDKIEGRLLEETPGRRINREKRTFLCYRKYLWKPDHRRLPKQDGIHIW